MPIYALTDHMLELGGLGNKVKGYEFLCYYVFHIEFFFFLEWFFHLFWHLSGLVLSIFEIIISLIHFE